MPKKVGCDVHADVCRSFAKLTTCARCCQPKKTITAASTRTMILPTIFLMMMASTRPITAMAISTHGALFWMVDSSRFTHKIYRSGPCAQCEFFRGEVCRGEVCRAGDALPRLREVRVLPDPGVHRDAGGHARVDGTGGSELGDRDGHRGTGLRLRCEPV